MADNYLYSILIVSSSDKGRQLIKSLILDSPYTLNIKMVPNSQEARRLLINSDFDIVFINSPLSDGAGIDLAEHIFEKCKSTPILLAKADSFDEIVNRVEGTIVIPKPINRILFTQLFNNAIILQRNRRKSLSEIIKLKSIIEEMRFVNQAKCLLIEKGHMTEEEAHRFIEKKAMDTRDKKVNIAIEIIQEYSY